MSEEATEKVPETSGNMYSQFKTNEDLEQSGIVIDYGDFRVTIARAGGANKRFAKLLEARTKPFRRALQTETMDPDKALEILRRVFSEMVVLNWETKIDGKFKVGIEAPEGDKLLSFNANNIEQTLTNLPELFADLQEQSTKVALFRETIREESAGN